MSVEWIINKSFDVRLNGFSNKVDVLLSEQDDKDLYSYYDPVDIIRHWLETNWRDQNYFGKRPTIKAVYGVRNIEPTTVNRTYIRPYGISATPTLPRDANYDFYDKDTLVSVDIQAATRKYLMKAVFEASRCILENRKNPEPNKNWWDLMYIQDETDRSFESANIFHYIFDVKLEKTSHSLIDFVDTGKVI